MGIDKFSDDTKKLLNIIIKKYKWSEFYYYNFNPEEKELQISEKDKEKYGIRLDELDVILKEFGVKTEWNQDEHGYINTKFYIDTKEYIEYEK